MAPAGIDQQEFAQHEFDGKVAIITGASKGIGHACASLLVAGGARVIVNARNAHELRTSTAAMGPKDDAYVVTVPGDVADDATTEALAAAAIEHFGRIDYVVNNT